MIWWVISLNGVRIGMPLIITVYQQRKIRQARFRGYIESYVVGLGRVTSTISGLQPEALILRNPIIRIVGFAVFVIQKLFFSSSS